eukprot:10048648-Alexandrium_andersonii.AAC.1
MAYARGLHVVAGSHRAPEAPCWEGRVPRPPGAPMANSACRRHHLLGSGSAEGSSRMQRPSRQGTGASAKLVVEVVALEQ